MDKAKRAGRAGGGEEYGTKEALTCARAAARRAAAASRSAASWALRASSILACIAATWGLGFACYDGSAIAFIDLAA
jgi:hypothetical protein